MFDRGFVTYSNEAKEAMLGVPASLIARHGAVSIEVARAMAEGALHHSRADVAIAVTGVAGPDGGTEEKPVGLVHLAAALTGAETLPGTCRFGPLDRTEIRLASTREALRLVQRLLAQSWAKIRRVRPAAARGRRPPAPAPRRPPRSGGRRGRTRRP